VFIKDLDVISKNDAIVILHKYVPVYEIIGIQYTLNLLTYFTRFIPNGSPQSQIVRLLVNNKFIYCFDFIYFKVSKI